MELLRCIIGYDCRLSSLCLAEIIPATLGKFPADLYLPLALKFPSDDLLFLDLEIDLTILIASDILSSSR